MNLAISRARLDASVYMVSSSVMFLARRYKAGEQRAAEELETKVVGDGYALTFLLGAGETVEFEQDGEKRTCTVEEIEQWCNEQYGV